DAAPEEEREPRRQFEIAEVVHATRGKLLGFAFGTEHELRAGEYALQGHLDAAVEVTLLSARFEETHQALDVAIGALSTIGTTRQRRQDLPGTALLPTRRRFARQDPAAAGHVARPGRIEGPRDRERRQVRNPQRVSRVM